VINAAYLNYSRNGKRWGAQVGLRFENTVSKGHQLGNAGGQPESRFEKRYTNLFPTAYLSYKLDSIANNQLVLSYGKRIDRPYFQDLNPFVSPLDKFTYYSGNPFLNPSLTHNLQLTYSYKGAFSTSLVYSDSEDNISETIEIKDGIYYSRPGNIGTSQTISLNANADFKLTKWYSVNLYSEVTNNDYSSRLYTETLDANGTYWFVSGLNRFNLGNDWSAEFGGRYHTDIVSSQFIALSRGTVNLSVMKKIIKGKGSLRLLANDIFYTNLNNGVINSLKNTDAHWRNKGDTRFVALAFTYSFGKMFESKNTYDSTGSQSEQERVKG
jgi:ferric enterobactin receptor